MDYYFYRMGYTPETIYYVSLTLTSLSIILRVMIVSSKKQIFIGKYIYKVILPVTVSIILIGLCHFIITNVIAKVLVMEFLILVFAVFTLFTSVNVSALTTELKGRLK